MISIWRSPVNSTNFTREIDSGVDRWSFTMCCRILNIGYRRTHRRRLLRDSAVHLGWWDYWLLRICVSSKSLGIRCSVGWQLLLGQILRGEILWNRVAPLYEFPLILILYTKRDQISLHQYLISNVACTHNCGNETLGINFHDTAAAKREKGELWAFVVYLVDPCINWPRYWILVYIC
jgi:hypothetical protein